MNTVPLLHSLRPSPDIRARLHAICALYAHSRPERRAALLDHLETLALTAAAAFAVELLEAGWRPGDDEPQAANEDEAVVADEKVHPLFSETFLDKPRRSPTGYSVSNFSSILARLLRGLQQLGRPDFGPEPPPPARRVTAG